MHPKTDIVCLVHNSIDVTKNFIQHIFKNTENFRLIFVDNASTDGTAELLAEGEKHDKWKVIHSDTNLGVIGGRNLGAQHIESEFFMNIDNDQYVGFGWLNQLHSLMNKGYDIVGVDAWCLLPPGSKNQIVMHGTSMNDQSYFPFRHCSRKTEPFTYVGCGGMLLKYSVYKKLAMQPGDYLFDPQFGPAYFEDPDLIFRAIQAGFKIGWQAECPIDHLAHQTFNKQRLFEKRQQFNKSWNNFKKKWKPYFPKPLRMT